MSDAIKDTERLLVLSGQFGRRRPILVGRGTTALTLLYEALTPPGGRVILPAIGCPSLLATVLQTERKPVIVDVGRNLNIDPDCVADAVQKGDVVVAIHLFGIPCSMEELDEICRFKEAFLIEDAAQAIGGKADGKPIGTLGKAAVFSFGEGKILPTKGGGAILTDDKDLIAKLEQARVALPARPKDLKERSKGLRDELTLAFNEARLDNPQAASKWLECYRKFGDIYRYPIEAREADEIAAVIMSLDEIARVRREKVHLYSKHIPAGKVKMLKYPVDCSPYRFTFTMPDLTGTQVQDFTKALRKEGLNASNLYLPLHWLAPGKVETEGCPVAEAAGIRVVNLWVDESATRQQAERIGGMVGSWVG